ncbi:MAG TPA: HAD family phosphatase [Nitrospirota bacterium]
MQTMIKTILLDFGGVMAEEGFYRGILEIGRRSGLNPEDFFRTADELIYETGYLTGQADEASFWDAVREKTGITASDAELRREILTRFVLRPEMLRLADLLKTKCMIVAMLSDQTNWLEEIDREAGLFRHFDAVFNSFRINKSKRDPSVFKFVCSALGVKPEETLFVDDNINHIKRAEGQGLRTIHFVGEGDFKRSLAEYIVL